MDLSAEEGLLVGGIAYDIGHHHPKDCQDFNNHFHFNNLFRLTLMQASCKHGGDVAVSLQLA